MKPPDFAALALLAVLSALAWHNHRRIATLQATRHELLARSADAGIHPGPEHPVRFSKRRRPDPEAEARRIASGFLAYAVEMEARDLENHPPDRPTRRRIIDQMAQITALNGRQLKILIEEILAARDVDPRIRTKLVLFSINLLTRDHPEKTLKLLVNSRELEDLLNAHSSCPPSDLVPDVLSRLARSNPEMAIAWFHKNRAILPEQAGKRARHQLACGVAATDLRRAFEILGESRPDSSPLPLSLVASCVPKTRESVAAAIVPIREWTSKTEDRKLRDERLGDCLENLYFFRGLRSTPFAPTIEWLENTGLTKKELGFVADVHNFDLTYHIKPEETGQWIEWLAKTFPPEVSRARIGQLVLSQRTRTDAETWRKTAPDTPAKRKAARMIAEDLSQYNPAAAVRWAMTLPAGPEREGLLDQIRPSSP